MRYLILSFISIGNPPKSLMEDKHPKLTLVGQAYDKPWHLEQYRPKVTD